MTAAAFIGVVLFGPFFLAFTVVTALVWAGVMRLLLRAVDRLLLGRAERAVAVTPARVR